ncbi:MAG: GvpL/GvpF family gas vesicle protein [Chlorobiaceae bacterium]|nr:GvpL/GvpF family gas vesicle protein [Chlorobiaceae bacterium]
MSIIIYAIIDSLQLKKRIVDTDELLNEDSEDNIEFISTDTLTAIVSFEKENKQIPSQEDLLSYASVVDKIAKKYSILPMRYGSILESYNDVIALLEKNSESFLEVLKKINNKEEFSIRVLFSSQKQISTEDGIIVKQTFPDILQGESQSKKYLQSKYEEHIIEERRLHYIEKIQSLLLYDLQKISPFIEFKKNPTTAFIIDAVVLIERTKRNKLLELVAAVQAMYPEHNVILTGPWPAYNFTQMKIS